MAIYFRSDVLRVHVAQPLTPFVYQITKQHGFSIPSLCVAMADRHVHDVEDFVRRIELFKATDDASLTILPPEQLPAFSKAAGMVVDLVRDYARGRGHTPQSLQDTPLLTAQHPAADADECFRATLLLQACYGAKFRPVRPDWRLFVRCPHCLTVESSCDDTCHRSQVHVIPAAVSVVPSGRIADLQLIRRRRSKTDLSTSTHVSRAWILP